MYTDYTLLIIKKFYKRIEILLRFRFADVMRHLKRNLQRKFHQSHKFTILVPWGLVNQFFHAVFLDRVSIRSMFCHQLHQFSCGLVPDDNLTHSDQRDHRDLFSVTYRSFEGSFPLYRTP